MSLPPTASLGLPKPIDIPSKRDMTTEELRVAEEIIRRGKQTFIHVGEALMDIRDRKGYRFRYETFEQYCKQEWGWTAGRARQLMGATQFALDIKSATNVTLENEGQARDLKQIGAEAVIEKLKPALETGNPKAVESAVRQIVTEHREEKKPVSPGVHYDKHEAAAPEPPIIELTDDEKYERLQAEERARQLKANPKINAIECPICHNQIKLDRFARVESF